MVNPYVRLLYIEFETTNYCTRKCSWCSFGNEDFRKNEPMEYLDIVYIEKLLQELKDYQYKGVLGLFGINEPLMDKRICNGQIILLCKKYLLPEVELSIVTNGDLLTEEILQVFTDTALDHLGISCYDDAGFIKAENYKDQFKGKLDIHVLDYRKHNRHLLWLNRAGSVKNIPEYEHLPYCILPNFEVIVGYDGNVRMCTSDTYGHIKLGNIKTTNLVSILQSEHRKIIKKKISKNRKDVFPCSQCNFTGGGFTVR